MVEADDTIIVIPARLASTRLARKVLAEIRGEPMIVHVWRRAVEAAAGAVVVACADQEVADAVARAGGRAALTRPELPSGSDRVHAALAALDPARQFRRVVNLQGDLPTIAPGDIRSALALLDAPGVDIGTIAAVITDAAERDDANVVKVVAGFAPGARAARALCFTRARAPWGEGAHYHHIGLYAYRRDALERFVRLPPSPLERRERLEQLRALEAGMRIDVALVDTVPLGVDTAADLEAARRLMTPAER
jgi:3-deoxy-manno-octulosonate cytidylyltransferase (CMP-KDO synthetase)